MKDFLNFRTFITPFIVKILFWLIVLVCWGMGIYDLIQHKYGLGIELIVLGPIIFRIMAEFILVIFKIEKHLSDLNQPCGHEGDEHG